jgi:isopenicillin N synthase-like dioxygenase
LLSGGDIQALNHAVKRTDTDKERYSFAFFSLPYPERAFKINQKAYTSSTYFEQYLNLFK